MHSLGITWSIARYGAQQSYSSHVRTKTSWRVHKGENAVTVVELRFTTILPLKLDPGTQVVMKALDRTSLLASKVTSMQILLILARND